MPSPCACQISPATGEKIAAPNLHGGKHDHLQLYSQLLSTLTI
jgi:hypothetical protein